MKKVIYVIFVCLCTHILTSCKGSSTEDVFKTKYALSKQYVLQIDSIIIPLDSISLPEYMSCMSYYEDSNDALLYAFNNRTWSIDVFDLNGEKINRHILLQKEGKDAITDVMTLQVISPDSIFIYDGYHFLLSDSHGSIFKKMNATSQIDDYIMLLEASSFTVPFYNKLDQKVYGRYMTTHQPYPFPEKELFASYDTKNGKWEIFPVELPEYMKKNWKSLGRNTWLNAFFYEDRISYNFSALSDVFTYEIVNKKNVASGGVSKLMNNEVDFYFGESNNDRAKWAHWLDNPNFNPVVYNKYQKLYYRIAFGEFIKEPSYTDHSHFDKEIILSIFNESLEMIYETKLPNYKFNFIGYFSSEDGLLTFGNNLYNTNIDYEKLVIYKIRILPAS